MAAAQIWTGLIAFIGQVEEQAAPSGGFFATNWYNLQMAVSEKNVYNMLINPYVIGTAVILVAFGLIVKSRKPILLAFAIYGYGFAYWLSLGRQTVNTSDYMDQEFSQAGPLAIFIVTFLVVTGIILYFTMTDD